MADREDLLHLADMFSHEFKTPIAIIMNNAQNMERRHLEGNMDDMDIQQTLESIRRCCNSLSRLGNNMVLAITDRQGVRPDRFAYDVAKQFNEICFMAQEYFLDKGITIRLDAKTNPAVFGADPDMIFRVMMNLISNAIKYNTSDEKIVDITLEIKDGHLLITVSDNGIGISKDTAEKMFDMYYRSDNNINTLSTGLGLGLYIANQDIKAHGGTIKAIPQKEGTMFKIDIPGSEDLSFGSPREVSVSARMLEIGLADLLVK